MRRPEVGRWFFEFNYSPIDYQYGDRFTKTVRVSALKLKQKPPEAMVARRDIDYDGMKFEMKFKWPVSIVSWR